MRTIEKIKTFFKINNSFIIPFRYIEKELLRNPPTLIIFLNNIEEEIDFDEKLNSKTKERYIRKIHNRYEDFLKCWINYVQWVNYDEFIQSLFGDSP